MKKTFTSSQSFFALAAIISFSLFFLSVTTASAQTASAVSLPMTTDAYPSGTVWKSGPDYSAIVASERANNLVLLGAPNLKQAKTALYTGYDRLLGYMQTDLLANAPIEDIADINFKRVTLESATDPLLVNMPVDEFNALYVTLVGKLKNP